MLRIDGLEMDLGDMVISLSAQGNTRLELIVDARWIRISQRTGDPVGDHLSIFDGPPGVEAACLKAIRLALEAAEKDETQSLVQGVSDVFR